MNKLITSIIALVFITGISSCVKDNFDAPPTGGKDPNITVNMSIDSLKARYSGVNLLINEDRVISAIVTADDKSGNFYKQIIIQDSTGGIALLLEGSNSFNDYPIGRRIFVKLKGLYIVKYKGVFQIACSIAPDGSYNGIPVALYDNFILKGTYFHTVAPKVVTINQLTANDQNLLIQLNNVEFQTSDAGKAYADGFNKLSVSRTIKDCNGGAAATYNSGYANFANHLTPTGNGTLVCIYSLYNTTGQLLLRDESDIHLDSVRCGGSVVVTGNGIMGIRGLYQGSDVVIPAGKTVTGVVISDNTAANFDTKNLVIQDSTGGIVIRFTAAHSFLVGDNVTVDLSGLTLTSYNGLAEVTNTPSGNATKIGTGTITPRVATTAAIQTNATAWQSTLLTVQNASIGGSGSTYSGNKTLTDGSGTLTLYTRPGATFSGTTIPSTNMSYTGVLGCFTTPQLSVRTLSDVQ